MFWYKARNESGSIGAVPRPFLDPIDGECVDLMTEQYFLYCVTSVFHTCMNLVIVTPNQCLVNIITAL